MGHELKADPSGLGLADHDAAQGRVIKDEGALQPLVVVDSLRNPLANPGGETAAL